QTRPSSTARSSTITSFTLRGLEPEESSGGRLSLLNTAHGSPIQNPLDYMKPPRTAKAAARLKREILALMWKRRVELYILSSEIRRQQLRLNNNKRYIQFIKSRNSIDIRLEAYFQYEHNKSK